MRIPKTRGKCMYPRRQRVVLAADPAHYPSLGDVFAAIWRKRCRSTACGQSGGGRSPSHHKYSSTMRCLWDTCSQSRIRMTKISSGVSAGGLYHGSVFRQKVQLFMQTEQVLVEGAMGMMPVARKAFCEGREGAGTSCIFNAVMLCTCWNSMSGTILLFL